MCPVYCPRGAGMREKAGPSRSCCSGAAAVLGGQVECCDVLWCCVLRCGQKSAVLSLASCFCCKPSKPVEDRNLGTLIRVGDVQIDCGAGQGRTCQRPTLLVLQDRELVSRAKTDLPAQGHTDAAQRVRGRHHTGVRRPLCWRFCFALRE